MTDSLEATAYHEAGHAVAGLRLGRRFRYSTIAPEPEDGSLGHVRYYEWRKGFDPDITLSPVMRIRLENAIVTALAGAEAQHRFAGLPRDDGWIRDGGESDRYNAIACAEPIAGIETRALEAYLHWLAIVTENLIASPPNWKAIKDVAAALLERQTLSFEAVQRVVWGDEMVDWVKELKAKQRVR